MKLNSNPAAVRLGKHLEQWFSLLGKEGVSVLTLGTRFVLHNCVCFAWCSLLLGLACIKREDIWKCSNSLTQALLTLLILTQGADFTMGQFRATLRLLQEVEADKKNHTSLFSPVYFIKCGQLGMVCSPGDAAYHQSVMIPLQSLPGEQSSCGLHLCAPNTTGCVQAWQSLTVKKETKSKQSSGISREKHPSLHPL